MKYIKYFLGFIALLVLLFITKGFINPSISYSSQIVVEKSLQESWAVMSDQSKIDMWLKGIKDLKHISGEKGTVGAVTQYTFDQNGQESVIEETITSISDNQYISMDFVMEDVMDMDYRMDFEIKDGKTYITSSTTTKGIGLLMRSMVSFMTSSMQSQEDENMNNLKTMIEQNTTNYFPEVQ